VGVGGGEDLVSLDGSVDDLADDVLVGEADNKSVLWRIVLVLSLVDQLLSSSIISLSL
jgi:hypothetical protein